MIDWEKELNEEQLEAVTYCDGPLLVLAGAGSGKTRVLTYRVAHMIEKRGISASNILLLTFTNKAAGEMKERVRRLIGQEPGFAGTFHSFCASILRRYGTMIGIDSDFVIYDEDDKEQAIKMAMKELNIDVKTVKPSSAGAAISSAKNELLSPADYLAVARGPFQKTVGSIWQIYQRNMRRFHALDFDDLLFEGVRLLQSESGRRKLTSKFEQILVDEYQDTNKAQYLLAKLLVDGRGCFTVVGDASQSIYSWRGADFRNLNYLERDYPDLRILKLEKNYRSTQTILDAAYGVIGKNTTHPVLKLQATVPGGDLISVYQARDEKEEARFILDRIVEDGDYSKFALLYRTNAQSRALEEAFIKRGVPYVLVGGTKFYERREVKDVLAYLRVVANPRDEVSWERIDKVGKRRRASFETWLEELKKDSPEGTRGRDPLKMSTEDLMAGVLRATDYLSLYDEKDEQDMMRLENIKELASVTGEFSDLTAFLENVALVQSEAQSTLTGEENRVTLMTMHAAKGLEFETVFVVGLEEGLFPHSRTIMEFDQLEEERRLCYVALTRAKNRLYLTYAQQRMYFGQRNSSMPSRFLNEIPIHLTKTIGLPAKTDNSGWDNEWKLVEDWEVGGKQVSVDKGLVSKLVEDDFADIDSW